MLRLAFAAYLLYSFRFVSKSCIALSFSPHVSPVFLFLFMLPFSSILPSPFAYSSAGSPLVQWTVCVATGDPPFSDSLRRFFQVLLYLAFRLHYFAVSLVFNRSKFSTPNHIKSALCQSQRRFCLLRDMEERVGLSRRLGGQREVMTGA